MGVGLSVPWRDKNDLRDGRAHPTDPERSEQGPEVTASFNHESRSAGRSWQQDRSVATLASQSTGQQQDQPW